MSFAVIDDYGDNWEEGDIAFVACTLEECCEWAEDANFHSASIIEIFEDGTRERIY